MASNPSDPQSTSRPARSAAGELDGRLERCGTVALARHVKDDGRALILYTREEPRSVGEEREAS